MPSVTVRTFGGPREGTRVSVSEVAPDTSLESFLASLAGDAGLAAAFAGKAVLLNGQSLARSSWREVLLEDGDVIAVIPMLVGG